MKMLVIALSVFISLKSMAASIHIKIKNVAPVEGTIKYLLFKDKDGYPDDAKNSVRQGSIPAQQNSLELTGLVPGEYAMTFLHDINNNGKMDTFFGLPKEAFGFSQNPKVFFGPPGFSRSKFTLEDKIDLEIEMKSL
jgi:uncharacterized protein (DUF2141 family)